jgi:flagellar basal-body rod protein FlgC
MLSILDVSASALSAERTRMNTIAENLANASTTRDAAGRLVPYRRKEVVFLAGRDARGEPGVRVGDVRTDPRPPRREWQPDHPDAVNGFVRYPNINAIEEMVDMIMASRAYEANVTAMDLTKGMAAATLRLLA